MPLLSMLARMFLLKRLFGGRGGQRRGHGRGGVPRGYGRRVPSRYGRSPGGFGPGRRQQSRGGFGMWGPFPHYSRQTRGGSRVSVGGCCLPIPLAFVALVIGVGALLLGAG